MVHGLRIQIQNRSSIKQFIAHATANPGKLTWTLGATGRLQHLAGVLLAKQAGLKWVTVPYKGGGPAMNDLLAGHASFMIESIPTAAPHIASGRIRALGFTGARQSTVPTIAEAGMPGFNVEAWFALMGPAGECGAAMIAIWSVRHRRTACCRRPKSEPPLMGMPTQN